MTPTIARDQFLENRANIVLPFISAIAQWKSFGLWFSVFWVFQSALHTLLLEKICTKFTKKFSCIHCKPIPVMKTGFSLCSISNREQPVFITWEPCNKNSIFPVWKYYTGKTLFWPFTGPVRDCSVLVLKSLTEKRIRRLTLSVLR